MVGRGNYISGERNPRKKSAESLATEVGEEPEEKRKCPAEDKASNDREIESGVFAAMDDVAGEFAETEGKFAAEIEKSAEEG